MEDALKSYVDAFQEDDSVVHALQDALQRVDSLRQNSSHWDNDEDFPGLNAVGRHGRASMQISNNVLKRDVFEDVASNLMESAELRTLLTVTRKADSRSCP